jgi:hypothetical protein
LSDNAFSALSSEAALLGKTPSELAAHVVEVAYAGSGGAQLDAATARQKFEQCFGSVDLGHPIGIGNEAIDNQERLVWLRSQETTFAKVWDSGEDAAYDQL